MPLQTMTFSQNKLQDFADCARRFQLKYLLRRKWPAVQGEPFLEHERILEHQNRFHRLAERHLLGIPADALAPLVAQTGEPLAEWWETFIQSPPAILSEAADLMPEHILTTRAAGYALLAKLDLLAILPGGGAMIVDWKTSRRVPTRKFLEARLQTRVYLYTVTESRGIPPESVKMAYWFAQHPDDTQIFPYDAQTHTAYGEAIHALISRIIEMAEALPPEDVGVIWPLTDDVRQCRFCVYRSLCERGEAAGNIFDAEDDLSESAAFAESDDFTLEDVEEIAF